MIWQMSVDSRPWGAPHIHGELLKLGFAVAQSTVAKYMAKGDRPGQRWGTFLRNHMPHIVAMDLFVVPTIGFIQLYVLIIRRWKSRSAGGRPPIHAELRALGRLTPRSEANAKQIWHGGAPSAAVTTGGTCHLRRRAYTAQKDQLTNAGACRRFGASTGAARRMTMRRA
jgi:hypothetical protein